MNNILKYLKYAFENDYPLNFDWLVDMLSLLPDGTEDEFVKVEDNVFYGKIKNTETNEIELLELNTDYSNEPLLKPKTPLHLPKGFLPFIDEDMDTTFGRLLANFIVIYKPFNNKVAYINAPFTVGDIEDTIIKNLLISNDEIEKKGKTHITIAEYEKFVDYVIYLSRLNRLIAVSSTEKTTQPPPNIKEYREKLINEYKKKYGDNVLEKLDKVAEIDKKLLEYEKEYLKDDPTIKTYVKGKVLNAMKKMYLSYGHGGSFYFKDGKAHVVPESLAEGWDIDDEKITVLYNDIREGSFKRGFETQKGGYGAKQGLRATIDMKVLDTDCGSKMYYNLNVTDMNYKELKGRYILKQGKPVLISTEEEAKKYIGKLVQLRTPMYCKLDKHGRCKVCMGEDMKNYENGIALMVIDMFGKVLNSSMKAMHDSSLNLVKLDLNDII